MLCLECGTETQNKKFCSNKCTSQFTHRENPQPKTWLCRRCGVRGNKRATLSCKVCDDCKLKSSGTKCKWHLCNNTPSGVRGSPFCSKKCGNKFHVTKRRKEIKERAVEYKGGKCYRCAYVKCLGALQFHHRDDDKEFSISQYGHSRAWEKVKEELDKCDLVCSNCHAEIHETEGY